MLHNGFRLRGFSEEERRQGIQRRIRFAHHGINLRFFLSRLQRRRQDHLAIAGGLDVYDRVSRYVRRLRFQRGAVPNDPQIRQTEWRTFRAVVDDQIEVQYSSSYILEPPRHSSELEIALHTRALLEPIRRMLDILPSLSYTRSFTFPRADSVMLRSEMDNLRSRIHTLEQRTGGVEGFREVGVDQNAAYEIADLFANQLLEDDDQDVEDWGSAEDNHAEWILSQTWAAEMRETIETESVNLGVPSMDQMPERIPELYENLRQLEMALRDITPSGAAQDITDYQLRNIARLVIQYEEVYEDQEDEEVRIPLPGQGPLRPLFFDFIDVMQDIMAMNRGRALTPGSSADSPVSSTAGNNPVDDYRLITDIYADTQETALRHLRGSDGEGLLRPGADRFLGILRRIRHIALRMWRPHHEDETDNQLIFDQLRESYRNIQDRTAGFERFGNLEVEARVMRVLDRLMPSAQTNPEVNPRGEELTEERERRRQHAIDLIQAGSRRYINLQDNAYVRQMQQTFRTVRDHWPWPDTPLSPAEIQFIQFLDDLWDSNSQGLHTQLEGEDQHLEYDAALHQRLSRYNVTDTPVGNLEEILPRLYTIRQRVVNESQDKRIRFELEQEARERARRRLHVRAQLQRASELYGRENDRVFLGQVLHLYRGAHLDFPSGPLDDEEDPFLHFLEDLWACQLQGELLQAAWDARVRDENRALHQRLSQYDVYESPVGDLENRFPRLYGVYQRLVTESGERRLRFRREEEAERLRVEHEDEERAQQERVRTIHTALEVAGGLVHLENQEYLETILSEFQLTGPETVEDDSAEVEFTQFLEGLVLSDLHGVYLEPSDEEDLGEAIVAVHDRIRQYDVENTPLGDIELNFPRLHAIWERLVEEGEERIGGYNAHTPSQSSESPPPS